MQKRVVARHAFRYHPMRAAGLWTSKQREIVNMKKKLLYLVVVCVEAALACGVNLQALEKNYELRNPIGEVSAHSSGDGLLIEVRVLGNPGAFQLDDGESFTFNFFNIWTDETTVNQGEDTVGKAIRATMHFVDPLTSQAISGVTIGGQFLWGLSQWGEVRWNGPVTVIVPGDRAFEIRLSNEKFNSGFTGLTEGQHHGATVRATITQISLVPDGGLTLMMLGAGCFAMGIVRRRFAK